MDVTASMDAPRPPADLMPWVDVLDRYPSWMPLVHRVDDPEAADEEAAVPGGSGPARRVELRARLGPFARSKRLRMVRTVYDPDGGHVRFERAETDGRAHSPWVLDVRVEPTADGCRLDMHLHYGGALWTGGVMERVLADQIVAGRERLLSLINGD